MVRMLLSAILMLALATLAWGHIVISYPGWRGNNLVTNSTFPYGMQWMFPCGGTQVTNNRTYWPTTGGALAWQPGWFPGHKTAFTYINIGFGADGPHGNPNISSPMVPIFQIIGPSEHLYPGTICLPQVPLPKGITPKSGDKATIQIVMNALHGAALFSCVDIEFRDPGDDELIEVTDSNCFNSTDIGFADVFNITTKRPVVADPSSSAAAPSCWPPWPILFVLLTLSLWNPRRL